MLDLTTEQASNERLDQPDEPDHPIKFVQDQKAAEEASYSSRSS